MNKKITKLLTLGATAFGLLAVGGCNNNGQTDASTYHHERTYYVKREHHHRNSYDVAETHSKAAKTYLSYLSFINN